jgi:hypothetical protein
MGIVNWRLLKRRLSLQKLINSGQNLLLIKADIKENTKDYHCKKKLAIFPYQATKLSLARNN